MCVLCNVTLQYYSGVLFTSVGIVIKVFSDEKNALPSHSGVCVVQVHPVYPKENPSAVLPPFPEVSQLKLLQEVSRDKVWWLQLGLWKREGGEKERGGRERERWVWFEICL